MSDAYIEFLKRKVAVAASLGLPCEPEDVNQALKPHQRASVVWAVRGGRRALFKAFGLGKTVDQLEIVRIILEREGGRGLIVLPLGVRQEFMRDAVQVLGWAEPPKFVRSHTECGETGVYLTNYETVRDGKIDPSGFVVVCLDEAAILRGLGGSKTFRSCMALLAGDNREAGTKTEGVRYRFVATAVPSPNDYIELLAYAEFLGIMDIGAAKTRWFKRNIEKADALTLRQSKEHEFWTWVATWALFVTKPSDIDPSFSDDGYDLPKLDVRWHELPSDHEHAGVEKDGQFRMFRSSAIGVQDAAREKRESLPARIAKLMELRQEYPEAHRIIWHDLEDERRAIEQAVPAARSVYGSQDLDERETIVRDFADGRLAEIAAKPVMLGSGTNLQRHCAWAIYLGIGFKFSDWIQSVHRVHRFLQTRSVRIDLIYTEAEREVRQALERKWQQHNDMVEKMTKIIREFGLAHAAAASQLARSLGVERVEASGPGHTLVNNDCVLELRGMAENSVDLIVTSIPFEAMYEYSPSYNDFGHTDSPAHFWQQMEFLIGELLRVLRPGRNCIVHVKDRITPGGINGLGFQTISRVSDRCADNFERHGFATLARKTIVTDVVRENNQTYRLGWSEQCKDGTRMGAGLPEYLMVFRKPPSDPTNGYADVPVAKDKAEFTRPRWQFDAHGFTRSSGNRLLMPEDLDGLDQAAIFQLFKKHSLEQVYDFRHDVKIAEQVDRSGWLPSTFMLLQPQSWHPDVWADVVRMRTLNTSQAQRGAEQHICLARDSRVLTKERGYVPIQDVAVGESCLTHMGRWRRVEAVVNTGVRPCITVKAHGVPGLTLTPEHNLWLRKSDWVRARDGAERAEPAWVEAKDSLAGYVNLKLPPVASEATESMHHWWIVGRWLADGHWDGRGAAIISFGDHELGSMRSDLGERFGGLMHTGTSYQVRVLDPTGKLKETLHACGVGAAGKHLPPEAFTLPYAYASSLLSGYLSGDGHYLAKRRRWMASSISRTLLLGVAVLVQRVHGSIASVYAGRPARAAVIQGRKVSCQQEWVLSFDEEGGRKTQFILADGAWKRVRSIADAGERETWCLRVEEDASFTAEGCVVKNCPLPIDLVERCIEQYSMPGETVLDPFGGLMTVPYCAVRLKRVGVGIELNNRYFLDGATYCAAAARDLDMPTLFDLDGGSREAA